MKKIILFLLLLSISVSMVGCKPYIKGRTEIDMLIFTRVFALDKGENERIKVTITSRSVTMQGGGAKTETKKANIISAEGRTVFEAVSKLNMFADRKPFYGHAEYVLIGEELAKEGILPYFDFIARDHEFRINAKVYIVNGSTARELLEKANTSEFFVSERLSNLEENRGAMSVSSTVQVVETMLILDRPFLALYLPCISMTKAIQKAEDKDKYDISLQGYAIFKDDKLLTHLQMYEARGINWVRDLVENGIIVVKDKNGNDISMEINKAKTKIEPELYSDGSINFTIKVNLSTNIEEILGTSFKFKEDDLKYLEKQQEEVVRNEIMTAIEVAKQNKLDFFSLGSVFFQNYPKEWDKYKKNWSKVIPTLHFNVQIKSIIKRTYLLTEPTRSKEDG